MGVERENESREDRLRQWTVDVAKIKEDIISMNFGDSGLTPEEHTGAMLKALSEENTRLVKQLSALKRLIRLGRSLSE